MKVVALIQARMSSTRLEGKVLKTISGIPSLKLMLDRVKKARLLDDVVVITSTHASDDEISQFCHSNNFNVFRGSLEDVLDRYYQAAKEFDADVIVRMTADCPLVDPLIIDQTIKYFANSDNCDYCANAVPPDNKRYPDGSDVEVFSRAKLEEIWLEYTDKKSREHVTFPFWQTGLFNIKTLPNNEDWGKYRITVDYLNDLILLRMIKIILDERNQFGTMKEIVRILEDYPELFEINNEHHWGDNW